MSSDAKLFAPPEMIAEGQAGDSPKRDLWSLGVLTYFLFAAHFPTFDEQGRVDFECCQSEVWDHISPDAKNFVQALLVQDPADRPSA